MSTVVLEVHHCDDGSWAVRRVETVTTRGELERIANPGDIMDVSGVPLGAYQTITMTDRKMLEAVYDLLTRTTTKAAEVSENG